MTTKKIDVRLGLAAVPVGELIFEVTGDREGGPLSSRQWADV